MATYYWVGGSGTWDNVTTTNWAASSGGAGGSGPPLAADNVIFDANSGTAATVTIATTAACNNCTIDKSDINLSLSGNFGPNNVLTLTAGTMTLNSYSWTCLAFASSNSNTRAIAFGTGKMIVTGNALTIFNMGTVTGFSCSGSRRVDLSYAGATGTRNIFFANDSAQTADVTNTLDFYVTAGTDTVSVVLSSQGGAVRTLDTTGFSGTLGTPAFRIYGNLNLSSTTTVAATTGIISFLSTTTGNTITTNGVTIDRPFTFNGVGGSWTLQDNLTLGSTRYTTLTAGTLNLNNNTLTTGFFESVNSNTRSIAFGTTGNITVVGNAATVFDIITATNFTYTGTPTVNATYSGSTGTRTIRIGYTGASVGSAMNLNVSAGSDTITLTGYWKNVNFTGFAGTLNNSGRNISGNLTLSTGMTITDGTNTTIFDSPSETQTITSNGRTFNAAINIGSATQFPTVELADALNLGTRSVTVTAGTFDTKGYNVTCASLLSSNASTYTKAIKLNNSTVTLSNGILFNFPNNFTFDAGTSSIVFTSATPQIALYYRANYTFYNVSFTNSAAASIFIPNSGGTVTFNNLSFPNATTTSYGVVIGGNIKVNGTLTLPTGSSYINRVTFYSLDGSTINAAAISGTLTDVDFRGITVTGPTAPWTGTRLGDGGGNSGITGFETPKTVYWSQAAGGNWSDTAWATSSAGTPALANYPILGDTVIFDDAGLNTSATVTVDRAFAINNLDFSARSNAMTFATGTGFRFINGNFTASSGITFSGTSNTYVGGWSGTSTFTSAGRTITFLPILSAGPTGNLVFADNLTASLIGIYSGNVDLNGKTFSTSGSISSQTSTLAIVNLNGATITSTLAGVTINLSVGLGSFGYKIFTGTCTFNCSSASAKSIQNGAMADLSGFTFVNTGAGALTFNNVAVPGFTDGLYGTYGDIQTTVRPATINFTAGQTFQFNNFTISGTSGNLVTLQSSTAGTQATLLSPNTVNSVSFCSIKDLNAINTMGYGEWQAYTTNGNVDAGNNTGWLFSPATPSTAPRPTIRLRSLAQRGNMT